MQRIKNLLPLRSFQLVIIAAVIVMVIIIYFSFFNVRDDSSIEETNYNYLNLTSMGTDETTKREISNSQYEKQLANMLLGIDGIEGAIVKILWPSDDGEHKISTSVQITSDKDFTAKEKENIGKVVMSAVKDLEAENLTIIDQNMDIIFSGAEEEIPLDE